MTCQIYSWIRGSEFAYRFNIQHPQRRADVLCPENCPFRLAHELQRFIHHEGYPEFHIARKRRCDVFVEVEHADSLSCVAHRVTAPERHGCRVMWQVRVWGVRRIRGRVPELLYEDAFSHRSWSDLTMIRR
jgi:hypothetical protein